jgi:hypothetical protein
MPVEAAVTRGESGRRPPLDRRLRGAGAAPLRPRACLRDPFEAADFGEAFTPELAQQEDRLRERLARG